MAKKVFLGVGHGGSDPGAVSNGFKEKDLNLAIALACQSELARHGVLTKMSRTKDENDALSEEIKECNAYNPDLAVDIHNNAGGGDGAEAICSINGGKGKILAENILAEIVKLGQNSRGVKTRKNSSGKDYFGFIRQIKAPSVIVECAFVDNKTDMKIIDTKAEQAAMGVAIAKGILKTLGISVKAEEKETPKAEAPKAETPKATKTVTQVAREVLNGKWGTGSDRKKRLTEAGYDYNAVQKEVNRLYNSSKTTLKSNEAIAKEVIQGKWGTGATRKKKLTEAGYNYSTIQALVNKMLK